MINIAFERDRISFASALFRQAFQYDVAWGSPNPLSMGSESTNLKMRDTGVTANAYVSVINTVAFR